VGDQPGRARQHRRRAARRARRGRAPARRVQRPWTDPAAPRSSVPSRHPPRRAAKAQRPAAAPGRDPRRAVRCDGAARAVRRPPVCRPGASRRPSAYAAGAPARCDRRCR
jgi:hypothetical protein